ncbi:hypothetical protein BGX23_000653 [Mortierella sp. AD031]|nr:hypothetical protein BGX23_000653 [Mortierella sp. AD031]
MVPSNSDIDMAPASPVMEPTPEATIVKDKDTAIRSADHQEQEDTTVKDAIPSENPPLPASEAKKDLLKDEGDIHDAHKLDTDDGTDADATTHTTILPNGTSSSGQHPSESSVDKKPRKQAERESKRGQKSSKSNGHLVEEDEHETDHQARHPSDEKYKRLKRKLKEVLEENERLGIELDRSNRRARNLRREKNILLDKICTYERESDSSPDTLSSMSSDSEMSDSSLYSHFRSRRDTPTKAHVAPTPNNKHLRVPSAKDASPSSPVAHHPKKTASKAAAGRRSLAVSGRKENKESGPTSTPSTITNVGSATQKPKRIHNSSKLKPNPNKIRKVQALEKDENGNIKFPVTVGIITLMKIGHVVSDREAFHNERYIWPVGYTMSRSYNSMVNPNEQTVYTCSVIDDGESPKFQIDAEDQPGKPIIAGTATGAWTHVVKTANAIRKRDHSNSASGPDYFGFSNATIAKMIQDLPHADECESYVWQRFEEPSVKAPSTPEKRKSSNLTSKGSKRGDGDQGENEEEEEEDGGEDDDEYASLGTPKKKKSKRAVSPKIRQGESEPENADKSRAASEDELQEPQETEEAEAEAEAEAEEGEEEGEEGEEDEQTLSENDAADEDVDVGDDESGEAPSPATATATATNPPVVITTVEEASESEDSQG